MYNTFLWLNVDSSFLTNGNITTFGNTIQGDRKTIVPCIYNYPFMYSWLSINSSNSEKRNNCLWLCMTNIMLWINFVLSYISILEIIKKKWMSNQRWCLVNVHLTLSSSSSVAHIIYLIRFYHNFAWHRIC